LRYEAALEADGFRLFPAARAFLEAHGGQRHDDGRIVFDPVRALDVVEPARVREWERRIGRPVCPVGTASALHQVVLIDDAGVLYTGFDERLRRLGTDGAASFDALLANRAGEPVPQRGWMSPDVLRRLERGGWHEDRCVGVEAWREPLRRLGFRAHGEALSFLREFGGLEVERCAKRPGAGGGLLRFDPVVGLAWIDPLWIHTVWAPAVGRPLYPVGVEDRSLELLAVDETGTLYGGLDEDLFRYGEALGHGLEALVLGGPRRAVR